MNDQEVLTSYLGSLISELVQHGMNHAVISPGSRSTPLAMLLASYPGLDVHMNMDERSAAFYALGIAKTLQEPVAIVCTSGTAAANYHPAVVEAYYSRIPLIVLTADRPHELRDTGAPQTIDQLQLYGKHVKWFMDMSLPENTAPMLHYAKTMGARAATTAKNTPSGPVHLNIPLREPLIPDMDTAKSMFQHRIPPIHQPLLGSLSLADEQMKKIAQELSRSQRGIIICGELPEAGPQESIIKLSRMLSFPILADPLSQLRSGRYEKSTVIDTYDTFLRNDQAVKKLSPDLVIRFGSMPVSKSLLLFLKELNHAQHIIVDSGGGWREPAGLPVQMIYSDERNFCQTILKQETFNTEEKLSWLYDWQEINAKTKQTLNGVKQDIELSEGKLFSLLGEYMPEQSTLYVGSSMPIRDVDTFFHSIDKQISIFANRGANGIDGVVSSAVGTSKVKENTVLALGDLSFYHDMNGLLAAKLLNCNITILVVNNDGGGIFSFLPQANEKEHFEELFGTPHGLDFAHAASLYGASYTKVEDWEQWKRAFKSSFEIEGIKIIEVPTERMKNVTKHRLLWNDVSNVLFRMFQEETD